MQQEAADYQYAADLISACLSAHPSLLPDLKADITGTLQAFYQEFGPEALAHLSDNNLLTRLFPTWSSEPRSLCELLEKEKSCRIFGSLQGGSEFKFGLFRRKGDGVWLTGSAKAPQLLTDEEALRLGRTLRDNLIKACRLIKSAERLSCAEDYEQLDAGLHELLGPFAAYAWVHKYLFMLFPDKLVSLLTSNWAKHFLYGLGLMPSDKYYGQVGQLNLVKQAAGLTSPCFEKLCFNIFGGPHRFIKLASDGCTPSELDHWRQAGTAAAGWKQIGSLSRYAQGGRLDKRLVISALQANGLVGGSRSQAPRRAAEIVTFYEAAQDAVITLMNGPHLIALIDGLGEYFFDAAEEKWPHKKKGVWHGPFTAGEMLPQKEALDLACAELKNPENLLFLYHKYYWPQAARLPSALPSPADSAEQLRFYTGYEPAAESRFERNRILFGAPGTGKSFKLNRDKEALLKDGGGCERVTFYPDYSYANFVGAYKPVPCTDSEGRETVTYAYVPGPFMRLYVQALQSGRTDVPKPFVLIIEELNRANAAAVFGDVFQLLDRDANGVSEYAVKASEDVKKYLAKELGGKPEEYAEIRLPDNMYLWATMNSADQGVFPLDTAFKRRWDFEYLGLDDGLDRNSPIVRQQFVLGRKPYQCRASWNELREAINDKLSACGVNEDKLLGPYFIAERFLSDSETFCRIFKNKVLMYLFEDAARQNRRTLFSGCAEGSRTRYSKICREFEEKGVFIFSSEVSSRFKAEQAADEEQPA